MLLIKVPDVPTKFKSGISWGERPWWQGHAFQDVNRHRGRKGERSKPVSNFSTHTAEIHGKFMNLKSTIPCGLAMLGPIRCSGCLLPAKRTEGSFRKQHHVALELPACVDAREVVVAREFQLRWGDLWSYGPRSLSTSIIGWWMHALFIHMYIIYLYLHIYIFLNNFYSWLMTHNYIPYLFTWNKKRFHRSTPPCFQHNVAPLWRYPVPRGLGIWILGKLQGAASIQRS